VATAIHPAKLANDMRPDQLLIRPAPGRVEVDVDPGRAGWRYLSLRVLGLRDSADVEVGDPDKETAVVIVGGGGVTASWADHTGVRLDGRRSVWDGLPWALYLPPGRTTRLTAVASEPAAAVVLAVGQAPPAGRDGVGLDPVVLAPDPEMVEIRGAGHATRQVTHIITPEFPAHRLLCVEVYTPGGNWSGWPPHKHDIDDYPHEAVLEETYFYQVRRQEGWGIQRLYRKDGSRDAIWAVRDGDVVFMPDGYHPFTAPPLYDAYYLNFLAGDRRTMANREDPDLAWVRGALANTQADPRVPLVRTADVFPKMLR
jgi:5-deoxy-glucuronate isomerase